MEEIYEKIQKKIPKMLKNPLAKVPNVQFKLKVNNKGNKVKALCNFQLRIIDIAKNSLKTGMTELELQKIIHKQIKKARYSLKCPILVSFGKNSSNIHGFASENKLKDNDVVLIDFGISPKLLSPFGTDITRTFFWGKRTKFQEKIYGLVNKAQEIGINLVKEGQKASIIDYKVRNYLNKNGYDFDHGTGHGIKRLIHADPLINQYNHEYLKKGDLITIEPGIYLPNQFGVRIEDTLLVTKDSHEILSR